MKETNKELEFNIDDFSVVKKAKEGDNDALDFIFSVFKPYIRTLSNKYYIAGADKDDLIQEGMFGLFKGIRDYNPSKEIAFKTFATVCVQRQIKTALKSATRQKHMPLNSSVSLQTTKYDDSEQELIEYFRDDNQFNPEEIYIYNETYAQMNKLLYDSLSKLEMQILMLHSNHLSYKEIAAITNKSVKSIDNAVQRIKKKLDKIKEENMSL